MLIIRKSVDFISLCAALMLFASGPVRAEFVACNQSFDVVNLAIGRKIGDQFQTEGWWTVGTNQCATLIKETLSTRYIYVFAQDVFGRSVIYGEVPMCVGVKKFSIRGIEGCWTRGLVAAEFREIDTGEADRWTIFLEPPPQ